jgi:hypothetical protein
MLAPRATRLVATGLTAVAGADFLQLAYYVAKKASGIPAKPSGPTCATGRRPPGTRSILLGTASARNRCFARTPAGIDAAMR